ncbi:hypothetical protein AU255_01315 [Methyloprofundus sedimenti]|uniref:Transposase n=1 Tax=Methyloprofundus sedimenti TaxID=1420851 RepID=A0A1V8M593_9GAMM|nr:hypothetical protein [Methyloprofundus sedimenti]OQK16573.1 hypothetical protein AU255_01315 [Methyloprofundus sedimenti]
MVHLDERANTLDGKLEIVCGQNEGSQHLLSISGVVLLSATIISHGGRSVVRVAHLYTDKRNLWISEFDQRRGKNISAVDVVVTNKNTLIAWALLTNKQCYEAAII